MENLEAKYVRVISRASAILETAKHGLTHAEDYALDQHFHMLDSIIKDAGEITKAAC